MPAAIHDLAPPTAATAREHPLRLFGPAPPQVRPYPNLLSPLPPPPSPPREVDASVISQPSGYDGPLPLTPVIFGAGTFSPSYSSQDALSSDLPRDTLLLALRFGINAVDTSPFYGNSESILGGILSLPEVRKEFPRESYFLITKCGRYGHKPKHFDYSRDRILKSVATSCERLRTTYLDVMYLHDVEFVASDPGGATLGGFVAYSPQMERLAALGLAEEDQGKSHGEGDEKVLEAASTLFELKDQGVVRRVGISGYPLPTLLRVARLIRAKLSRPLDIILSYSHHTLQDSTLASYVPALLAAGVPQIVNASALSMGLLRAEGPQPWHPAPPALRAAAASAARVCREERGTTLERVALGFGITSASGDERGRIATAVGFSNSGEVEECVDVYRELYGGTMQAGGVGTVDGLKERAAKQREDEKQTIEVFEKAGYHNWAWPSPPPPKAT